MRLVEVLVRGILAIPLLLLVGAVANYLQDAGISSTNTFLLCAAIVLLGIAFGAFVDLAVKPVAYMCLILAIICIVIFLVLQYHLIPVCGDNICSAFECGKCGDCSALQCANNVCEAGELCSNTPDCACRAGEVCMPQRGNSSDGCASIKCGDNFCDTGEQGCCVDCGCQAGFFCTNNACKFIKPTMSAQGLPLAPSLSTTTLVGNPTLTDAAGVPQPLAGVKLKATAAVNNANITFSLDGLLQDTLPLGDLGTAEVTVLWYPTTNSELLKLNEQRATNIIIRIQGLDSQGDPVSHTIAVPFTLKRRDTTDKFGHVVLFVTDSINATARSPEGIWEELRTNMSILPFSNTYQFPIETLRKKSGSEQDFALLLASAYQNASLRPIIVQGTAGLFPDPARLLIRIRYRNSVVTIDPSLADRSFEDAIVTTPGVNVYDISAIRMQRNFTVLSVAS